MMQNLDRRLRSLEDNAPPLVTARLKKAQGIPFEQWTDQELDAYTDAYCQDMKWLTDQQLNDLIAAPDQETQERLYAQFEATRS